ncbi:cytochrome c [Methylomicrobium sp. Wu6]|uniref:c-type cytochrome n=1 Tax=Methylomicrobium sp. Wu6 TaxID=3107928 RepID=UPI002DD629A2|nr:cytochrome c [Methylomicrobium sp. Wu6]MEC4747322.1 cytochrome c [Methylomicrobium sp. Wu6]
MKTGVLFVNILMMASTALADESSIQLKEGPGKTLVTANCTMCHSLDYIQMNSGVLDNSGWQKTVDKMIKVMGAPIKQEDVDPIVAYLAKNYGK